ncbi:nicotinamide riboside transporter PnuC [Caulobacter sp. 17J65-9]|uniref:nicotinamide riboside transporter PnuC n=1 Tax=Caulobacter sp. 17J65-9 TaxID=2709382 RepID=UPI0013C6DE28|nr:nicotinamide riboside transporter PnuC [Caulobacter sp. 17J65-9]NEX93344.1 nicotinamide mononucleotide transporter [Caulobacter sp. 17J65-9]
MSLLEIAATLCTVVSVFLTVHLKRALYPIGILGVVLFFFVFWNAKLYASAGLQVYFALIQLYGWWFWARGDRGREPPIGDWSWRTVGLFGLAAAAFTALTSWGLYALTDAQAPVLDTAILALSALAQFLLDRKQMKNWIVWGVVDLLSIYVYAGQQLWLTTGLYVLLFANVFYGWAIWRRAYGRQAPSPAAAPQPA